MNSVTENKQDKSTRPDRRVMPAQRDRPAAPFPLWRTCCGGEYHATCGRGVTGPAQSLPGCVGHSLPVSAVPGSARRHDQVRSRNRPASICRDSLEALRPRRDDARILKDNLPWIERYLRQKLDDPDPVDAPALFAKAAAAMQEQLDLEQASREKLDADLERLKAP